MSITDSGSVQRTSRTSPGLRPFSAFRLFKAGSGHFSPVRSSFVLVAIHPSLANLAHRVNDGRGGRASHQAGIADEADALAGFNLGEPFAEFDQAIGLHQRRQ